MARNDHPQTIRGLHCFCLNPLTVLVWSFLFFLPETHSPGSLKIQTHASRAASSGLTQRSAFADLKLSPHLPETLPSSSKRLVSWPQFRVANPSLAGFQVSVQTLALVCARIASGHIYAAGWTLPARAAPSKPRKRRQGKEGTDGPDIHDLGLTVPEAHVLQLPSFVPFRAMAARRAEGLRAASPAPAPCPAGEPGRTSDSRSSHHVR